jgi:hypothetical protein
MCVCVFKLQLFTDRGTRHVHAMYALLELSKRLQCPTHSLVFPAYWQVFALTLSVAMSEC